MSRREIEKPKKPFDAGLGDHAVSPREAIQIVAEGSWLKGSAEGPLDAYRHLLASLLIGHHFGEYGKGLIAFLNLTEQVAARNRGDENSRNSALNDIHNNLLGFSIGIGPGSLRQKIKNLSKLFSEGGTQSREEGKPAYSDISYGTRHDVNESLVIERLVDTWAIREDSLDKGAIHGPPPPPTKGAAAPDPKTEEQKVPETKTPPPVPIDPKTKTAEDQTYLQDLSREQLLELLKSLSALVRGAAIDLDQPQDDPREPPTPAMVAAKIQLAATKRPATVYEVLRNLLMLIDDNLTHEAILGFLRSIALPRLDDTYINPSVDWGVSDPPKQRTRRIQLIRRKRRV